MPKEFRTGRDQNGLQGSSQRLMKEKHLSKPQMVKEICLQCVRPRFDPWVRKIPWRRAWQCTSVFLPGESPGQREKPEGLQSTG